MFDIINNTNNKIEEIEILQEYVTNITKKLKIEKAIFNIILVDEKEIHTLNKNYRKVDRKTDVYLCVSVAYEQAEIYGHSKIREICFLATHGILHLLGYDHMNEEEELEMFSLQEELLKENEINR